jgi:4-hydroxybutyrate CoA-transferase
MTVVAPRQAVAALLQKARRVAFPPALGEPDLVAELPHLLDGSPIELLVPYRTRRFSLDSLSLNISIRATFGGPGVHWNDYTPVQLSRVPELIGPSGPLAVDVALVRLSPADRDGRHNVGPSASLTSDLVQQASTVIAEIDPDLPITNGDTMVLERDITLQVDAAEPLELPSDEQRRATEPETRLAEHVANLVPDGSYVEIGVGSTTGNIADALSSHTGLRLIAGLATPTISNLQAQGVLDDRWPIPVGEAYGPRSFMRFIERNPLLSFQSTRRVHNSRVLGSYPNFTAINGALAVDLLGRVACESSGPEARGGLGGLAEFLIAGRLSPGGINVVALTSTASGTSRIVHRLPTDLVSIPTFLTDYVVTEWGIADLRGATRSECRDRIAAIAHPRHRSDLETEPVNQPMEET